MGTGKGMGMVALVTQVGLTMAISIVVGLLIGIWVDSTFGIKPIGSLVFSLFGVIVGAYAMYRTVAKAVEAEMESRKIHDEGRRDEE